MNKNEESQDIRQRDTEASTQEDIWKIIHPANFDIKVTVGRRNNICARWRVSVSWKMFANIMKSFEKK